MFVIIETLWNCASCHEYMPALCCYLPHNCYNIRKPEQRRNAHACHQYHRRDKMVWTVML